MNFVKKLGLIKWIKFDINFYLENFENSYPEAIRWSLGVKRYEVSAEHHGAVVQLRLQLLHTGEYFTENYKKNRYFELLLRLPGDAEIPREGISSSKRQFFYSLSIMIGNIFAPDLEHDGGRDRGEAEADQGEDEDERPHDVSWARVGPGVKRN